MGSSAVSQLQASAAQAVADLGGNKHQHEEGPYMTGNSPLKRPRMNEPGDMRSNLGSQLGGPSGDSANRSIAA